MLTSNQIARLTANWGERADALDCNAEVRIYDPVSPWECYIFALDPSDQDTILCIFTRMGVLIDQWTLSEMGTVFNSHGEGVENDLGFIPIHIARLIKKLEGLHETTGD